MNNDYYNSSDVNGADSPIMIRRILRRFDNRISEAVKAIIMVGIGFQVLLAPRDDYLALRLLNHFFTVYGVGIIFLIIGTVRLSAILANGTFKEYGPWMRAVGAGVGSMIWAQMFLSLVAIKPPDVVSLGGPVFFTFTVIEILSVYRALGMRDCHGTSIQ